MSHGSGRSSFRAAGSAHRGRGAATLAALVAGASLLVAPPAAHAVGRAFATVTDGCGRVDRVDVNDASGHWIEVLPDGKAAKLPPIPTKDADGKKIDPSTFTEKQWAAYKGYTVLPAAGWTRPMDTSTTFAQVRVLTYAGEGRFAPIPLQLAGADAATGARGTETFRITNEDCVTPAEPTFTDEEGSAHDTVTIPEVVGVKYSGKPGTTPGKGTVTVTATPDKGYRFAGPDGVALSPAQTRWSFTFDGTAPVEVPDDKAPTFRLGAVTPAAQGKPASRGPNVVTVEHVPGITWIVDGKPQKTSDKALTVDVPVGTKTTVKVQAVSADPKSYVVNGTTSWVVGSGPATGADRPTVAAPTTAIALGAATATWAPPADFPTGARYNVRYRVVTLTKNSVRAAAPWRPLLQETTTRSGILRAKPGSILEVSVQAVAGTRASAWSNPTTLWYPADIKKAPDRSWKLAREKAALGGTMATTTVKSAAWTGRTTPTNRIMLWFGTSKNGAPAAIYVDGKHVTTVSTSSRRTTVRQVLKPIPVRWGRHVVTVVHAGPTGTVLRLDGAAYGR